MKKYFLVFSLVVFSVSSSYLLAKEETSPLIQSLIKKADDGDLASTYILANIYYKGGYGEQSFVKAKKYFIKAAEAGYSRAYSRLGLMAEEGLGFNIDFDKAAEFYRQGIAKGDTVSKLHLARLLSSGVLVAKKSEIKTLFQESLKEFLERSDQGDTDADLHLGILYYEGNNDIADYKKAVKHFQIAEKHGLKEAKYYLGQMHLFAYQFKRNTSKGIALIEEAAEAGSIAAALKLRYFYTNGLRASTVAPDTKKQAYWEAKLRGLGHPVYLFKRAKELLERNGNDRYTWSQALPMLKKSAEQGYAKAEYLYATCYLDGMYGVERNASKGVRLLNSAIEHGDIDARKLMAKLMRAAKNKTK